MDAAINIVLLLLVFGLARWKKQPYAGAVVFALVKGGLYASVGIGQASMGRVPVWAAIVSGAIALLLFGGLAAGMIYFLRRLDRADSKPVTYSTAGADRMAFKWEYLPITAIILVLLFGEMWIGLVMRSRGH